MGDLTDINANVAAYFQQLQSVIARLDTRRLAEVVRVLLEANQRGNTIYIFGNGGSAATASHFANDLSKGCCVEGQHQLRAVSLTDNIALITALANDTGFENIYSAQVKSLARPGDIVIGISGSGNSPNVLNGLEAAREAGAFTIGLCGFGGGKMSQLVDLDVTSDCVVMQQVEDLHLSICHNIACSLKAALALQPTITAVYPAKERQARLELVS